MGALKLLREDLRRLCETQGVSVPLNAEFPHNTTVPLLKLLDACLHARHFGTMCPPCREVKGKNEVAEKRMGSPKGEKSRASDPTEEEEDVKDDKDDSWINGDSWVILS